MSSHNMGSVKRHIRINQLIRRDGEGCYWCKRDFAEDRPRTMDHVIPRSLGGSNGTQNLVLACEPCNRDRAIYPSPRSVA